MRLFDWRQPALALAILASLAGCASSPNQPAPADLSPERSADALQARSLRDPELHRYLAANLGRDPGDRWDFESLCWVAFRYNPSLAVARAQWDAARAAQRTAAQRPNPTLTITPGYDFTHQEGVSPWMPSIGFDFLLATRGKRAWQQEIAAADADAARLAVYASVWQVRSDLRKALIDLEVTGRRLELLKQQVAVQRKMLGLLDARLKAGAIASSDLLATRTAWLRAESASIEIDAQAGAARDRVAVALGIPSTALADVALPSIPAATPLDDAQLAVAKRAALLSRADVLSALAKYRSTNATLGLELARRTPDVHLGPAYQYDQGLNKWSLGLTLELPVFNRNEGAIAEAAARRTEAAAQVLLVQAQALAAIDSAAGAVVATTAQLKHAREIASEAAHQRQVLQQRRDAGGADEVEFESADLDAATAEALLLDAESAARAASAQLEDALQVPFPNIAAVAEATAARNSNAP